MAFLCTCKHGLEQHQHFCPVANSKQAFIFSGTFDPSEVAALPEDVEHPPLGQCLECACTGYVPAPRPGAGPQ
jgi:hypothetical protein